MMKRPRVKSVFPPFPLDDRIIRIGGVDYGIAGEIIDDEKRHVWQLLQLLDGSRSMEELIADMQCLDPCITGEDVRAAVVQLAESGYLEDAAIAPPTMFSPEEVVRYRRNAEYFSYYTMPPQTGYDIQARLRMSRVTILGVGGLGSYVALALTAAGVGDLLLVDDDHVQLHNLNRQVLYSQTDVGDAKIAAAARRLGEVNPYVTVTTWATRVSSVDDARACMEGRDLLVCAADRPRIRLYDWINEASIRERVPWLRGANDGLTVNMFMHVPGQTACFACDQREAHAKIPGYAAFIHHAMEVVGDRTVNPCTAPVSGLIGSLAAIEAVKLLSGVATPASFNRKLIFDLQQTQIRFRDGIRHPDCDVCGDFVAAPANVNGAGVSP